MIFGMKEKDATHMKKLALIGFGNQGKAWARNLKDSGWSIEVFARENGESYLQSQKEKFKTSVLNSNNLSEYNQVVLTAPDHSHLTILKDIVSKLKEGTTVILLHGYSFCYDNLSKEFLKLNFALLAPKAIASELRFQYESNGKLGAVYSLEGIKKDAKEENKNFILTLAHDLGITAGPYEVRFKDETIADLFSEQSILCSTVPYSALKAYNMLREKGVS
ncbi:MAG: ketol-acid reductoisomerase, partial [Thermoproteota archaeon]